MAAPGQRIFTCSEKLLRSSISLRACHWRRFRVSEEWLRFLCVELFRENVACRLEEAISRTIRIVDGTIVREPGKTGSQWRILYSVRLPTTGTCPVDWFGA